VDRSDHEEDAQSVYGRIRETVRSVKCGLAASQVAWDLGLVANTVARWVREDPGDTGQAFPGQGKMKVDAGEWIGCTGRPSSSRLNEIC